MNRVVIPTLNAGNRQRNEKGKPVARHGVTLMKI